MFLRCFSFFLLCGCRSCILLAHPFSRCLPRTFSTLPVSCGPASSSTVGKRLRLGPAGQHSSGSAWLFFMLVDILLCTDGLFPVWCRSALPTFRRAKLESASFSHLLTSHEWLPCSCYPICLDCAKHFCQPGTDHQNSEVKEKPCQAVSLQTLYKHANICCHG